MDFEREDEEETKARRSRIWMIVSVIAILIGIVLLGLVLFFALRRRPHCPECIIAGTDIKAVDSASSLLQRFKQKVQELGTKHSSCNPLDVSGTCPA